MRISDWSSDVCSSDLQEAIPLAHAECAGICAGKIALRRRSRNSRAQSGISLLRVARPPVVVFVNRKITIGAARISHVEHDPRRVFTQRHCAVQRGVSAQEVYVPRGKVVGIHGISTEILVNARLFLVPRGRSEEHTSELQSLMRISYAVFCLKKTNNKIPTHY